VSYVETRNQERAAKLTIPFAVLLVEVSSQSSELEEIVLFESGSECDRVESVVGVGRISESLVVFFLDEELVVRFVDGGEVVVLNRDEVVLDHCEQEGAIRTEFLVGVGREKRDVLGSSSAFWNILTTRVWSTRAARTERRSLRSMGCCSR
jgi:hypothetical protein